MTDEELEDDPSWALMNEHQRRTWRRHVNEGRRLFSEVERILQCPSDGRLRP